MVPGGYNKESTQHKESTQGQHALITAGLITAAGLILRNWKSTCTPELADWTQLMTEIASY